MRLLPTTSRRNILAAERQLAQSRHHAADAVRGLQHAFRYRLAQLPTFALTVGFVALICWWWPARRPGPHDASANGAPSMATIILALVVRSGMQHLAVTLVSLVSLWRRRQRRAGVIAAGAGLPGSEIAARGL